MTKVGSIRFEIKLDLNNTENYEISLLDLMKQTDKNVSENNKDELEEVHDYVKQLEKKYGPVAVVKGKKIRVNDFLIQGTGYDADDPFIDDSGTEEAIVVAPDLMTQYGGFFINNDTLKLSESSFVIDRVEGENDSTISSKQPFQHKTNKMMKSQQLISQARKRLNTTKKSSSNHKLDEIINDVVSVKIRKETNNGKIEHDIVKQTKKQDSPDLPVVNKTPEKEQTNGNLIQQAPKIITLPAYLPENLIEKIKAIIEISSQSKTEGSKLSNTVNSLLMEVDMILTAKNISKVDRCQVLRYLSNALDMKYETIARKINKFKENRKKSIQHSMLKNLEDAILEAMPDSLAKYETDKQIYQTKLEAAKTENQIITIDITNNQEIETKTKPTNKITCPKRYFKWNPKCKLFFYNLVGDELEFYKNGKSKSTPEEHLSRFFNSCVINLWPPKWMSIVQLNRISAPVINEFKICLASGKEYKPNLPLVKQKTVHKLKNNQNGTINKPKDSNVNSIKHTEPKVKSLSIDLISLPPKEIPLNPIKVMTSPPKILDKGNVSNSDHIFNQFFQMKGSLDNNNTNESTKSRTIDNQKQHTVPLNSQQNKIKKLSPLLNQMPCKIQQTLPCTQNFNTVDKNVNASKEAIKRSSIDLSQGSNIKPLVLNHQDKAHSVQMIHRMTNEDSLPYMYNHLYSNHSHVPCSVNSNDQQIRINHHLSPTNNQYAHSNPFSHIVNNVSPENIHKISNRQSGIQTAMLSPTLDARQNIPQLMAVSQHKASINNHHNLQQAQNLQRHYLGLQADFDSPNKSLFHQHSNPQTIELIDSSIPLSAHQLSPDLYYNFNNASHNNQRRYQN